MKESIRRKLDKLNERFEEVGHLLGDPAVISKQNQFRELSMEYSRLNPLVDRYRANGDPAPDAIARTGVPVATVTIR